MTTAANPILIYEVVVFAWGYILVPLHKVSAPEYAIMQKGHLGIIAINKAGSQDRDFLRGKLWQFFLQVWLFISHQNYRNMC